MISNFMKNKNYLKIIKNKHNVFIFEKIKNKK
jgi:uncharacterized protein YxeA